VGSHLVASEKWAVEGFPDSLEHLSPAGAGDGGQGERIEQKLEIGGRGEEPKLGVHRKQSEGGGVTPRRREERSKARTARTADATWGRGGARGASTCRRRDGPLRCDREEEAKSGKGRSELSAHRGPRRGACGRQLPEHLRDAREGQARGDLGARGGRREASGRTARRREHPHLRGGGGAAAAHGGAGGSPEAAPGAQLRPGAPRHASRRAPGEGAAWPRTTWRRRRRRRVLRRRRGSGQAPATSPGGGGGGAAPALLLLQLLPSGKGRAAAAAPPPIPRLPPPAPSPSPAPSPRLPPPQRGARLPSDSPPPVQRRANCRAAAARTRPGLWTCGGACATPGPFRGDTETERCLGARGRLGRGAQEAGWLAV
jgi:hypothetical protein